MAGLDTQARLLGLRQQRRHERRGRRARSRAVTTTCLGDQRVSTSTTSPLRRRRSPPSRRPSRRSAPCRATVGALENRLQFAIRPGAVAEGQQAGRREPDPRRQHRGGIGEHDEVQHPDAERHRRPCRRPTRRRRQCCHCSGKRVRGRAPGIPVSPHKQDDGGWRGSGIRPSAVIFHFKS